MSEAEKAVAVEAVLKKDSTLKGARLFGEIAETYDELITRLQEAGRHFGPEHGEFFRRMAEFEQHNFRQLQAQRKDVLP